MVPNARLFVSCFLFCICVMTSRADIYSGSDATLIEASASSRDGDVKVEWRLPERASIQIVEVLQGYSDDDFQRAIADMHRRLAAATVEPRPTISYHSRGKTWERAKADFQIDHRFTGRIKRIDPNVEGAQGGAELYVKMPAHEALDLLKTAFVVCEDQVKYQIARFVFRGYDDSDIQDSFMIFLAEQYDSLGSMAKADVMLLMFGNKSDSPITKNILERSTEISGDGRVEVFLRDVATDLLKYLETRDPAILEKHKIRL